MSVSEQATYQYAGNNPVSFNDPLGLKKDSDSWGFYNKWVAKQDFAAAHSRAVEFSQWCSSWFGGSSDVLGDGFEGGGGYGRSSQYYSAMKDFAREQATYFQQEFSRATTAAREAAESVLEYVGKDIAGYRLGVLLDNGEISSIIINSVDECGNSILSPIIFDIESGYVGGAGEANKSSWFDDHYFSEGGFDVSVGAQATFVPIEGAVVPAPFIRGGAIGIKVNLGSVVLVKGQASVKNGASMTTITDSKIVTQGFGLALGGTSIDYTRTVTDSKPENVLNLTTAGGLLGVEYNFTSNQLSIGMMPSASFSLIVGVQGYLGSGLRFQF